MDETRVIWLDGELVPWGEAQVHVLTHGLHYGSGVFEGIRCYKTDSGPAVFRLEAHLKRLVDSARLLYMPLKLSLDELREAVFQVVSANELEECYLRPLVFYGYGELGVNPGLNRVSCAIAAWPWGAYLGEIEEGVSLKTSSWRRVSSDVIPHVAKATGVYLNSMLATQEARRAGYDEALLLAQDGSVADGAGENVFAVKDGRLLTPDLSASILPGITRATVIELARELGYEVEEKRLLRSDLYLADELFLTGTATEVAPVKAYDDQAFRAPGPLTEEIRAAYLELVQGRLGHDEWLERPPARAEATEVAVATRSGAWA